MNRELNIYNPSQLIIEEISFFFGIRYIIFFTHFVVLLINKLLVIDKY